MNVSVVLAPPPQRGDVLKHKTSTAVVKIPHGRIALIPIDLRLGKATCCELKFFRVYSVFIV